MQLDPFKWVHTGPINVQVKWHMPLCKYTNMHGNCRCLAQVYWTLPDLEIHLWIVKTIEILILSLFIGGKEGFVRIKQNKKQFCLRYWALPLLLPCCCRDMTGQTRLWKQAATVRALVVSDNVRIPDRKKRKKGIRATANAHAREHPGHTKQPHGDTFGGCLGLAERTQRTEASPFSQQLTLDVVQLGPLLLQLRLERLRLGLQVGQGLVQLYLLCRHFRVWRGSHIFARVRAAVGGERAQSGAERS